MQQLTIKMCNFLGIENTRIVVLKKLVIHIRKEATINI